MMIKCVLEKGGKIMDIDKNREEIKNRVFNTKTKEEINKMLIETEKKLQNPNTKYYSLEEMKKMTRGMIDERKRLQNKVS